ncbi:MAG TPA: transcription antitermination factor NusB [Bryobacteraceae bacterium]|nr:transcription antitermination factor NusB [Bryobacteraceae bacterium]
MPSRHRSREHAAQILYQWDMRRQPVDECIEAFYGSLYSEESAVKPPLDEFLEQLVRGTVEKVGEIDALISSHAEHWRLERMPAVDRNILRLAIYEMCHTGTPAAVVIDEALELARRFSTEESVQFVNGVLDAVRRGKAAGT